LIAYLQRRTDRPPGCERVRRFDLSDSRKWATVQSVPTTSDFERMLRGVALRVTRPRVAVLSAVHDHPHADTDSIIRVVRGELGEVSHQAVYDVLRALTAAGLVRRFQPTGSVVRYEARVADNHHHIVCRSCGAIADVDCAVGATPCLTAKDDHGFRIDEAEVIYWGRCPECVAESSAVPGGRSRSQGARHQQNKHSHGSAATNEPLIDISDTGDDRRD
jgi:Fe2+ or Zn2+ uptake regulation protein